MSYVHTRGKACKGCNKCIFKCPTGANEAFFEAEEGKVFIKEGYCISCGECLAICDHKARDYYDDTEVFFQEIEKGEQISVVIAPAAQFNFAELKRLIGYLKQIGVNAVYDVSFGADICTWAHVKVIKEDEVTSVIAQPCPVVVSFVEKYHPDLIGYLSPIQSPVICIATYLKKYLGVTDKIMFLSPCIGKKRECSSEHTNEVLDYNVTFSKFTDELERRNIDITACKEAEFDMVEGSLGFAFPRPGGLSENIKYHLEKEVWIKQIEGIFNIERYFKEYLDDIDDGNPVPLIIDALNCEYGCNLGTGSKKHVRQNEVDYVINRRKIELNRDSSKKLMNYFDKKLNILDFYRGYTNRSKEYEKRKDIDLEKAYLSLGKISEEDRNINCFCCGYGNCHEFVYDLALGHNDKNNCRHYLLNKFKKLSFRDELTGLNNRYSYQKTVNELEKNHPGFLMILYADINGLKEANDTKGHSYGDELILSCAAILRKVFGERVYRVGGDEFIVLDPCDNDEQFAYRKKKLRNFIDQEKELKVSVGVSKSYTSADLQEKMKEADTAMYNAKKAYYQSLGKADRRKNQLNK